MARVLVIDDVATNRDVLIPLLHYLEHETAEAADGEAGLAMVESFRPELIICDILMPTMDGFEFVKRLRKNPNHSDRQVIFYTATFLQHEAWSLARSCGVENVITKPSDPEIVMDIVSAALANQPAASGQPQGLSDAEFDAEHLRLLTAKLTENSKKLQDAHQRLAALTDLCAEMAGERDPVVLLQRLCHGVRVLFAARAAVLFLREDEQGAPVCHISGAVGADKGRWLEWAQTQAWGAVDKMGSGAVRWSPHTAATGLSTVPWEHDGVPRHALAAPLATPDHSLGWLILLDSVGDHEFSADDETTLTVHLRQVSRIYENSFLHQRLSRQLEQLRVEVAVRERAERLLELEHAVAKALAGADSLSLGADAVVAVVCERLGWNLGRFWQVDEPRGLMTVTSQWLRGGSPLVALAQQTVSGVLHHGEGLAGRVWASGEALWVPQLRDDLRLAPAAWHHSPVTGSASLFPVKVGERVVGVLSFLSDAVLAPDEAMHQTASGVAQQLGQFIARREAEHRLNVSERFHRATLNALAEQVGVLDAGGRVLAVNDAWRSLGETLTHTPWRPEEGADFLADGEPPPDAGPAAASMSTLRAGVREVLAGRQEVFTLEYAIGERTSETCWFVARVTRFELDARVRVVIAHEDISERKRAELRAQRLHRVTSVLSAINSLIVRATDTQELFEEACRIAVDTGRFLRVWIGLLDPVTQLPTMVAWRDGDRKKDYFERFSQTINIQGLQDEPRFLELVLNQKPIVINDIRADSWMELSARADHWGIRALALFPLTHGQRTIGWLSLHAEEAHFFDAEECRLLAELAGDISFAMSHIRQSENMQRLAYYDQLTGCANAALFNERLSQSVAMAASVGQSLVLAILDIDGFKSINDNLGRHVGDQLLEQVARRLLEVAADPSRVARVGADQFAVMLPRALGDFELLRTAQQVYAKVFDSEFAVGGDLLQVSARVGLAVYPRDGDNAGHIFDHAEAALKRAKGVVERVVFYDAGISAVVAEKFDTERRLRQALQKNEFLLHYQPKYELRTGRMTSVEALIRWRGASGALIPPATFIPLMEETGLIVEAGRWILRQAVSDRQLWLDALGRAPRVSVNVAVQQLHDPGFLDAVQDALALGGADPGLDIEITESGFVDDVARTIAKLVRLRDMGVGLAVDDFGTGYSSLSYLARLPLSELKIDQSFVRSMLLEPATDTLVRSMVSLARAMKMTCVAEGVETIEQAQRLRELDCDQVQGYLISRPVAADAVPSLYQRSAAEVLGLLGNGA